MASISSSLSPIPNPCMFCQQEVEPFVVENFDHSHKAHVYCLIKQKAQLTSTQELTCASCQEVITHQLGDIWSALNCERLKLDTQRLNIEGRMILSKMEIQSLEQKSKMEIQSLEQKKKEISVAQDGPPEPFKVAGKTVAEHLEEASLPAAVPPSFSKALETDPWVPFFAFRASSQPYGKKGYYCVVIERNDIKDGHQRSRLFVSLDKPAYHFEDRDEKPVDPNLPTFPALIKAMKLYHDDAVNTHYVPLQELEMCRPGGKSVWQAVNELPRVIHEDLDGISGKKPEGLDPFFQQALTMGIPILFAQLYQNMPEKHKYLDQGKIGCAVAVHLPELGKTEVTPYLAYTGTPQWEWRSQEPHDYAETQTFVQAFFEHLEKNCGVYRLEEVKAFVEGKDFTVSTWAQALAKRDLSKEVDLLEEELTEKCTRDQPAFKLIRNQHDKIFLCSKRAGHPMQTRRIRVFKDRYWFEMDGTRKVLLHEVQFTGNISSDIRIAYSKQGWMDVDASETNKVFDDGLPEVSPQASAVDYRYKEVGAEDSNWRDNLFRPYLSVAASPEPAGDSKPADDSKGS